MKEEILRDKLQNLSVEQLGWINEYCDNNMSKLKKISYNAFFRYGIPEHEHDELYDDAMNVLMESVVTFDSSQGANFNTYLTNNIKKSVIDWYRDNYQRGKRRNLLTDKNGRIVKVDKDGNITSDQKGNRLLFQTAHLMHLMTMIIVWLINLHQISMSNTKVNLILK